MFCTFPLPTHRTWALPLESISDRVSNTQVEWCVSEHVVDGKYLNWPWLTEMVDTFEWTDRCLSRLLYCQLDITRLIPEPQIRIFRWALISISHKRPCEPKTVCPLETRNIQLTDSGEWFIMDEPIGKGRSSWPLDKLWAYIEYVLSSFLEWHQIFLQESISNNHGAAIFVHILAGDI